MHFYDGINYITVIDHDQWLLMTSARTPEPTGGKVNLLSEKKASRKKVSRKLRVARK